MGHLSPGVGADAWGGLLLEQSPAARGSKAHSDALSEIDSWRDDASSSLATCSAGDRTVTVMHTQRVRMGEHLKGKMQNMIRQRFDNYLGIIQTLQNGCGKLTTLECELRSPTIARETTSALTSIYCNEDGTFLVALVPDPNAGASAAVRGPAALGGSSSSNAAAGAPAELAEAPDGCMPDDVAEAAACMATSPEDNSMPGDLSSQQGTDADDNSPHTTRWHPKKWVDQVCEFGMSGRCHSLTALFHFGYTTWKQLCGDMLVASLDGRPGHIAEEEELQAAGLGAREPFNECGLWSAGGSGNFPAPPPATTSSTVAAAATAGIPASVGAAAANGVTGAPTAATAAAAGSDAAGSALLGVEGTGCANVPSCASGSPPAPSAAAASSSVPCGSGTGSLGSCSAGGGGVSVAAADGGSSGTAAAATCAAVAGCGLAGGTSSVGGDVAPSANASFCAAAANDSTFGNAGFAGAAGNSPVQAAAAVEDSHQVVVPPPDTDSILQLALLAADDGQFKQALELCNEGIDLAQQSSTVAPVATAAAAAAAASSSSAMAAVPSSSSSTVTAPRCHFPAQKRLRPDAGGVGSEQAFQDPNSVDEDMRTAVVWQFLSLRASVQVRLRNFSSALQDAEELIALQPTCAEGYYWQSTALQGMGRSQEALEALMSALEYEPQNSLFQQAFTQLFEEISAASGGRGGSSSMAVARAGGRRSSTATRGSPTRSPPSAVVLQRRARGGALGDALSTTTQATHLSSRSTTPTEVSERLSRSSSNDSVYEDAA